MKCYLTLNTNSPLLARESVSFHHKNETFHILSATCPPMEGQIPTPWFFVRTFELCIRGGRQILSAYLIEKWS